MKPQENQEMISIIELFDLLRRNLVLIIISSLLGLMLSLGYSTYRYVNQETTYIYSLTTLISVTTPVLTPESLAMINFTLSHPDNLSYATRRIGLSDLDYTVSSRNSEEEGIIIFVIEGIEKVPLTQLSRDIFNRVKPIVETSLFEVELRKLEINNPVIVSQTTSNQASWVLNSILGVMLGFVVSIFYVMGSYFLSPHIISDYELETVFNSKILGKFVDKPRKSILRKLFEVR
jgi:capsular polysaccharide biosynthesis protein